MAGLDRDDLQMVLDTITEYAEANLPDERLRELDAADEFLFKYGYSLENPVDRAELLGNYHESLRFIRKYFLKDFYTDHVKRYRKCPIYWMFSSSKGTFNALIYLHRYRPDTVSVVLQYLRDLRKKLVARLDYLQKFAISTTASQGDKTKANKEAETIKKQQLELDDYERDTLYPLATEQVPLDLNVGVKVNYLRLGSALKKIVGLEAKED